MSFKGYMRTLLLVSSLLGAETLVSAQQSAGQDPPHRQTTLASINEIETPTNPPRTGKRTIVQTATSLSKFAVRWRTTNLCRPMHIT